MRTAVRDRILLPKFREPAHPMSSTITLEQAQSELRQVIESLAAGEQVVITVDDRPRATLTACPPNGAQRPAPGAGRGAILSMAADFDELPEGFREYVP